MQHKQPQNKHSKKPAEASLSKEPSTQHEFEIESVLDTLKENMLNESALPHTSEPESAQPISDHTTSHASKPTELLLSSYTGPELPAEKNYYRVREVAALLNVGPHVLRFWETEFSMVRPTKSKSGQRVYRRKDVEVLCRIRYLLHEKKLSIRAAREVLLQERRQRLGAEVEEAVTRPPAKHTGRHRPESHPFAPTADRALDLKELLVDLRGLIRFCDQDPFQFQNG